MSRSEKHISAGKKPCEAWASPRARHERLLRLQLAAGTRSSSQSGLIAWCMPTITGSRRRRPPTGRPRHRVAIRLPPVGAASRSSSPRRGCSGSGSASPRTTPVRRRPAGRAPTAAPTGIVPVVVHAVVAAGRSCRDRSAECPRDIVSYAYSYAVAFPCCAPASRSAGACARGNVIVDGPRWRWRGETRAASRRADGERASGCSLGRWIERCPRTVRPAVYGPVILTCRSGSGHDRRVRRRLREPAQRRISGCSTQTGSGLDALIAAVIAS